MGELRLTFCVVETTDVGAPSPPSVNVTPRSPLEEEALGSQTGKEQETLNFLGMS